MTMAGMKALTVEKKADRGTRFDQAEPLEATGDGELRLEGRQDDIIEC